MFLLAACLTSLNACGDDGPTTPRQDTFDDVIASGGQFPPVSEYTIVTDSSISTELRGNENWVCTTKTYEVAEAPETFPLFDPNSELIFPGNLVQGRSLGQATPEPIPVRRSGGRIVVTLNNGATTGVSRTVPTVSLGSIYDAANEIIGTNPGDLPARFTFTTERVQSNRQLAVATDATWEAFSLWNMKGGLSIDVNTRRNHNKFLVKLNQSFYTVAFELPTSAAELFADDVTPSELSPYIGPGNPATFISSVTFGRIFYLLIESTASSDSVEASINLSFSGALGKFADTTKVTYVDRLDSLHITAYALGGDANQALRAVTSGLDSLKDFLAEGGTITTGVPVSYVVRSVQHPEKIVRVGLNTRYDVRDCRPIFATFGQPIFWLQADNPNIDTVAGGQLSRWPDLSAMQNDAYLDRVVPASQQPRLQARVVNGEMPAVVFGDSTWLRLVGSGFAGTDYTLAFVASFALNPAYGFGLIGGTNYLPGRMLEVGFLPRANPLTDPYSFGFGHFGTGVTTNRLPAPDQFHLYTLEFSRQRGMTVYVDGQFVEWNPAATMPLVDFLGARIGNVLAIPNASVALAEVMAFRTVLSTEQRQYLEDNLMRKYKF